MTTHLDLEAEAYDLAAKAYIEGLISGLVDIGLDGGHRIVFPDGENLTVSNGLELRLALTMLRKGAETQRSRELPC